MMKKQEYFKTRRYLQTIYLNIEDYSKDEIKNALLEAINLIDEVRMDPEIKKQIEEAEKELELKIQKMKEEEDERKRECEFYELIRDIKSHLYPCI